MPAVITRAEYMSRSGGKTAQQAHHDYYAQFVTPQTIRHVAMRFDIDELAQALDKGHHLNTIKLHIWDTFSWTPTDGRLHYPRGNDSGPFRAILPFDRQIIAAAGETVTRATLVCIAKTAARIAVEQARSQARETAVTQ